MLCFLQFRESSDGELQRCRLDRMGSKRHKNRSRADMMEFQNISGKSWNIPDGQSGDNALLVTPRNLEGEPKDPVITVNCRCND